MIFLEERFYDYFIEVLQDSAEKFDHIILAYCLMGNHAHFIIRINQSTLSDVMQNINYRFARWSNQQTRGIGHLFQGRYRSIQVNDDEYLIDLLRYIHFNPVSAKIVRHIDEYKWSSHWNYISQKCLDWLDVNYILNVLMRITSYGYKEFIEGKVRREDWKPAFYLKDDGSIVIDDSIISAFDSKFTFSSFKKKVAAEKVVDIVCCKLSVSKFELLGPSRERGLSKKRALLAQYLLKYSGVNMSQVAKLLNRTHATVARQMKCLADSETCYFNMDLLREIESLIEKEM